METIGLGIHLQTRDRVKILDALRSQMAERGLEWAGDSGIGLAEAQRFVLSQAQGKWVSLYPEAIPDARALGEGLAAEVGAPVFLLGQSQEAAFFYQAFDSKGACVDEYHSCPDYDKEIGQDDASDEELERTRGQPGIIAALLGIGGGTQDQLAACLSNARIERLREHDVFSDTVDLHESLHTLSKLLGLPASEEDYFTLWDLAESGEVDEGNLALTYAPPRSSKAKEIRERWDQLVARLRKRASDAQDLPAAKEAPTEESPEGKED